MAVTQSSGSGSSKKTTAFKPTGSTGTNSAYQKYLDSLPNGTPAYAAMTQNEFLQRLNANQLKQSKTPKAKASPRSSSGSSTGSSRSYSGGGSVGYSSGPNSEQKKAAKNLTSIAQFNVQSTKDQLARQFSNFDMADKQNKAMADTQQQQASRSTAADRFAEQKKMQSSTSSLRSAAGNALQGSGLGSLVGMIGSRNDLDNNSAWTQLTKDRDSINNKYAEAYNANQVARNDAAINAEYAIRGIEADTAAQRNNINSSLFVKPGAKSKTTKKNGKKTTTASGSFGSSGVYAKNKATANLVKTGGYLMPDNALQLADALHPDTVPAGNDYFSKLFNLYKQRG